jgi:hypothetical protein
LREERYILFTNSVVSATHIMAVEGNNNRKRPGQGIAPEDIPHQPSSSNRPHLSQFYRFP